MNNKCDDATYLLTNIIMIYIDIFLTLFVISIYLNACQSWTLTTVFVKRRRLFEMRCYRRLLKISYKDYVTSAEVRRNIQAVTGEYGDI